jgi:hypothetical protein
MAWGQRRMVGRNSSITDRFCSVAQAVQTITVNGGRWRGAAKSTCYVLLGLAEIADP